MTGRIRMSREQMLKRLNQLYSKQHRRLVRTKVNDPRWVRLGDYYIISTRTNAIMARHFNFAAYAEKAEKLAATGFTHSGSGGARK